MGKTLVMERLDNVVQKLKHLVKTFIYLLVILITCSALTAYAKDPVKVVEGKVVKVSDGDTVQIVAQGTKLRVRLYGIDAPETPKFDRRRGGTNKPGQPYGDEAKRALVQKIAGKRVLLEIMDVDQYGRSASRIIFNGRDINYEMVKEGWAWAYRRHLDRPYASDYINAETQARKNQLGLWQQTNPQPPWEFRKASKIRGW